MAHFSLECDGLFIPDEQKSISEDPFDVLDEPLPEKSNVILDPHHSDISDDDFEIPCSQKRLPPRYVKILIWGLLFFWIDSCV